MLIVDGVFLPRALLNLRFRCPYDTCGGACCVVGDSGAPILPGEIDRIKDMFPAIAGQMDAETAEWCRRHGFYEHTGNTFSTACVNGTGRCVFTQQAKNRPATCILEKMSQQSDVKTLRPVSCRLFPLRIRSFNGFEIIDYEHWEECRNAWNHGSLLVDFCKAALTDYFGSQWVEKLNSYLVRLRNDMG
jgi:hypothetical protein